MSGYKFGLAQTHFSHPDWVCTDWFRQFTASQPFQSFHHEYVEWLDMVEIGIHPPQPSPHPNFWVEGGEIFGYKAPTFHTKFECVQTDSAISYQLDPSNLSL